jgi:hypothetical protein
MTDAKKPKASRPKVIALAPTIAPAPPPEPENTEPPEETLSPHHPFKSEIQAKDSPFINGELYIFVTDNEYVCVAGVIGKLHSELIVWVGGLGDARHFLFLAQAGGCSSTLAAFEGCITQVIVRIQPSDKSEEQLATAMRTIGFVEEICQVTQCCAVDVQICDPYGDYSHKAWDNLDYTKSGFLTWLEWCRYEHSSNSHSYEFCKNVLEERGYLYKRYGGDTLEAMESGVLEAAEMAAVFLTKRIRYLSGRYSLAGFRP